MSSIYMQSSSDACAPTADQVIPAHVPLAVATRGGQVESVHYGSVGVIDAEGRPCYGIGDPHGLTFTRSACKPFQALALLQHPGSGRWALGSEEIAMLCASHSGEPRHVERVRRLLERFGFGARDLGCGVHPPLYLEALGTHDPAGSYTALHHNCSGKHAGMLALSKLLNCATEAYLHIDHPVQQAILAAVARCTGVPASQIVTGTDGCGAANFAVPLAALARAYARLGAGCFGAPGRQVYSAMLAHPELVSGQGRFDLALCAAGRGAWVNKGGAEGVIGIAIGARRWGIAIKIADGAARALQVAAVEVLRQLGLLDRGRDRLLAGYAPLALHNARGTRTGEVRAVFRLA